MQNVYLCVYYPILCAVWFFLTFIVTYIISVCRQDVIAVFPYISDTGTWSPESCIFGLMLNIGAIIQGLIVYIRYRQLSHLLGKDTFYPETVQKNNRTSLILGITAAFGVCIVANFQETNAFEVHVFGAILAFGLGSVYQCMQTHISFKVYPNLGNKTINIIRVIFSIVSCVTFLVTFLFAGLSLLQFKGDDPTKWSKDDGGYVDHFISAIAEWIMAVTTILFLAFYTSEFKKISFTEPPLIETTQQA
ncbi:DNA damage-regulated autophagy modulator protein 2-like Protein [Tribolium castaneum]|uniref:DNA damage-regulated autophagy modulator protein 2-like Protein n=1 Tax=Tribolium castaneum TaxID=7070 RepID=A0A139WMI5_TRICA|nr:PREDICTED: DNA damage-regulated autophagy modulator protein 2-like [Tribolium castaneum]KYB29094.1 DNA damage-regulated autophagy modulator protein 2-like Protein [Tribolium castaneum]|eukprot:XP_008201266.1 PREDICTED: DNA damage-regulated autophagy modulator protein 2-like [Tribolium castaneum]